MAILRQTGDASHDLSSYQYEFHQQEWSASPLGAREHWPQQLSYLVEFILTTQQPTFVLWGSEKYLLFNKGFALMLGADYRNLLGLPVESAWSDIWPELKPYVDATFAGQAQFVEDAPFRTWASGYTETRYYSFFFAPIRNFDGSPEVVAAICTCFDNTEKVLGNRSAEEQRRLLDLTIQNVNEGIVLVDDKLRLVAWNEHFCTLFGYPSDLLKVGMSAGELMMITAERGDLGEGDPSALVAAFVQSIRSSESNRVEISRTNGVTLDVFRKTIPAGYFIMTARDVTAERQATRLKDELISTVSHELRTPLTSISGALGLLAGGAAGELPPKAASLVKLAHNNSDRLIRLVNDLLDMDKLGSGAAKFDFKDVDLRALITEAVEHNGSYADGFGVRILSALPPDPVVARVDAHRILQVLANLISNAAKFSPAGSEMQIALSEAAEMAMISVEDQGPGIPEVFRPRLFTRFAQSDASDTRTRNGTGLGLAISKSIIEAHGGEIRLASTGQGSRFEISLPLRSSTASPSE